MPTTKENIEIVIETQEMLKGMGSDDFRLPYSTLAFFLDLVKEMRSKHMEESFDTTVTKAIEATNLKTKYEPFNAARNFEMEHYYAAIHPAIQDCTDRGIKYAATASQIILAAYEDVLKLRDGTVVRDGSLKDYLDRIRVAFDEELVRSLVAQVCNAQAVVFANHEARMIEGS